MRRPTAAGSRRPRKGTRSWPTTWSSTRARSWTPRAARSGKPCANKRRATLPARSIMAGPQSGHDFFAISPRRAIRVLRRLLTCHSETASKPLRCWWKDPAAPVWPVDGTWRVAMNWDQIEGNWMKAKGKLRQQWGKLTDDDLARVKGKRAEPPRSMPAGHGYATD